MVDVIGGTVATGLEDTGNLAPGACDDVTKQSPIITTTYDEPIYRQRRAIATKQGTKQVLELTIRNECGDPVNLVDLGFLLGGSSSSSDSSSSGSSETLGPSVKCRFREASFLTNNVFEADAVVADVESSKVRVTIPAVEVMAKPGIWLAEFGLLDPDETLLLVNECFIFNQNSAWGSTTSSAGPPAVDTLRLSLRDQPQQNELLDNYDFSLPEICYAVVEAVRYWNDQPPPVRTAMFTTSNFPFRDIWLSGIHYYLFMVAEEHYRRNFFQHNAGGTATDDKNRHREYAKALKDRFEMFHRMVVHRKVQLNVAGGYNRLGSGNARGYY